jgi:putative N6-adenine-specific DNA methylase
MRSPFQVHVEKPKREGEATLLYPFDARVAWVAACYHRTSSRISWDLCSSGAVRLEPLFADLVPTLSLDDRLPEGESLRFSVEVGPCQDFEASPLQLRGVVKNAIIQALASRGVTAELDVASPEVVFVVRRAGVSDEARRTVVGIDIGGGARHRRGARVVMGPAPMRETMAAQLIMLSRWDARTEPLVDPMAGGGTIPIEAAGLAVGAAIRRPMDLALAHLTPFEDLPIQTPDLFPGTVPRILALDIDDARIPDMVGNLRAAGLTGPSHEKSIVIAQQDVRALDPNYVGHMLGAHDIKPGVFCFNPPYGVRMGAEEGDDKLLALYSDVGRAFGRFKGWRAACFVANPRFVDAFGHRPALTKPASNADLRGTFLVFEL